MARKKKPIKELYGRPAKYHPVQGPAEYKKISGKRFQIISGHTTKASARAKAAKMRKQGRKVRVVSYKKGYVRHYIYASQGRW